MKKFLIISILFLGIANNTFSQESKPEITQLIRIIQSDSLVNKLMHNYTSKIISNAVVQIQGAGAKEKFDTYSKFILKQSDEISNTFTNKEIPSIYGKHFTSDEIREISSFYETPTGKNFLSELSSLMSSMKFGSLHSPETYASQLTPDSKKNLSEFYKTPTGNKLFQEMPKLATELMTSLFLNYMPDFQQKLKKELARLDSKIWREAYRVKPEQVTVYKGEFSQTKKVVKIQNDKNSNETYVTFAVPIYDNKWWIRFDKNIEIIDQKSGEQYRVLRLDNNLVLNKTMIVSDQKNKMIEVIMVFPLLKKSVKQIDIVEKISDDADLMSNNGGGDDNNLKNIIVKKYLEKK